MNQNDQIRQAIILAYTAGNLHGHVDTCESRWSADVDDIAEEFADEFFAEQALNHTPDTGEMVRLTDEEIEALRHETFSTSNPFCPCDSKTMRKAANAVMHAMIAKNPRPRLNRDQVQPIIERLGRINDAGWVFSEMGLMALISEVEDLARPRI